MEEENSTEKQIENELEKIKESYVLTNDELLKVRSEFERMQEKGIDIYAMKWAIYQNLNEEYRCTKGMHRWELRQIYGSGNHAYQCMDCGARKVIEEEE
jgi:hypothetical protein